MAETRQNIRDAVMQQIRDKINENMNPANVIWNMQELEKWSSEFWNIFLYNSFYEITPYPGADVKNVAGAMYMLNLYTGKNIFCTMNGTKWTVENQ